MWGENKTKQESSEFFSNREDVLGCKKAIPGPLLVGSIAEYCAQCVIWTEDLITHCCLIQFSFHKATALSSSENVFMLMGLDFL